MATTTNATDAVTWPPVAPFRRARPEDAASLAVLINLAGDGIPCWLWSQAARSGETAMEIGAARAQREDGGFSYRNAIVAAPQERVIGLLLAYRLPEAAEAEAIPETVPQVIRAFIELEREVPDSYYINALAVRDDVRSQGWGRQLLTLARAAAATEGCSSVSLQVFAQNEGAIRLYRREGFRVVGRRPVFAQPAYPHDTEVLLLAAAL